MHSHPLKSFVRFLHRTLNSGSFCMISNPHCTPPYSIPHPGILDPRKNYSPLLERVSRHSGCMYVRSLLTASSQTQSTPPHPPVPELERLRSSRVTPPSSRERMFPDLISTQLPMPGTPEVAHSDGLFPAREKNNLLRGSWKIPTTISQH